MAKGLVGGARTVCFFGDFGHQRQGTAVCDFRNSQWGGEGGDHRSHRPIPFRKTALKQFIDIQSDGNSFIYRQEKCHIRNVV